ncbi:hypothetical protein GTQ40_08215 [Flavobacteriaceae bacterium R38]|nr:hypothetical protein [Flavobacteriaceae bacterium R38]
MSLRVDYKNLEYFGLDGGGSEILYYEGKPFTGIGIEYYKSGALLTEFEYQNGYLEGLQRGYHENGQINEEYLLKNNIVVPGTFKEFDQEGNLLGSF